MSKRTQIITISGKTEDGKFVVRGVFRLHDTYGFALSDFLMNKDCVPDWINFYSDAIKHLWSFDQIQTCIEMGINDSGSLLNKDKIIDKLYEIHRGRSSIG